MLLLPICSHGFLDFNDDEDELVKLSWRDWRGSPSSDHTIHADSNEKIIVLLAKTSDLAPEPGNTKQYFEELLFGNQVGSMNHYYQENSLNTVEITGDVSNWIQLDNPLYMYDEDYDGGGQEFGIGDGVEEAVSKSDGRVDFSTYDQNNDGIVDNIMIIFVGESDSSNGDGDGDGRPEDSNAIWPLKWSLQTDYETDDGVVVSNFFVCTETCPMGTFAHEFAHNLGLPDLYDTDYSSNGVGKWSIMASGNYLEQDGVNNPSHLDAWSKYKLGWINPQVIDVESQTEEILLNSVEKSGHCLKVIISDHEYFLIEYRSTTAGDYDRALPSGGVLVWHIDESVIDEYGHFDNSNEEHPVVRLIQKDGYDDLKYQYNDGDASDVWVTYDKFTSELSQGYYGDEVDLNFIIGEINDGNNFVTLSFQVQTSTAWFYSIDWSWQDTDLDGFAESIMFDYDIDATVSLAQVDVEIIGENTLDGTFYQTVKTQHTVSLEQSDSLQSSFSIPNWTQALIDFVVILSYEGTPVDQFKPEHLVWLEDPTTNNLYDEYFGEIEFQYGDTNNDQLLDSIQAKFTYISDNPNPPVIDVRLEIINPVEANNVEIAHKYGVNPNTGTYQYISVNLEQTNLRPGTLDIYAVIEINGKLEEIFHASEVFNWESVFLKQESGITLLDQNSNGLYESLEIELHVDDSFDSGQIVEGWIEIFDFGSEIEGSRAVFTEYFVVQVGPPERLEQERSDLIHLEFIAPQKGNFNIKVTFMLPNSAYISQDLGNAILVYEDLNANDEVNCPEYIDSNYDFFNLTKIQPTLVNTLQLYCLEPGVLYTVTVGVLNSSNSSIRSIYEKEFTQILPNASLVINLNEFESNSTIQLFYTLRKQAVIIIQGNDVIETPYFQTGDTTEPVTVDESSKGESKNGSTDGLLGPVLMIFLMFSSAILVIILLNRKTNFSNGKTDLIIRNHEIKQIQITVSSASDYTGLPPGGKYEVIRGIPHYYSQDQGIWKMNKDGSFTLLKNNED